MEKQSAENYFFLNEGEKLDANKSSSRYPQKKIKEGQPLKV